MTGRVIYSNVHGLITGYNEWEIDLKSQPSGMYYLVIRAGREILNTQKLIKQ